MNADGSRTVYQFDDARHKAVATTTGKDGEPRQTIRYEMDDAGRFSSGRIFGANGRLRFVSRYKYDADGRLQEETQSSEDGTLLHKIVYDYDENGKQTTDRLFHFRRVRQIGGPHKPPGYRIAFTEVSPESFTIE